MGDMPPLILLLGDQLFHGLPGMPQEGEVWMREDWGLCTRVKHHKQKIVFFLAAMRAFASQLDRPLHYQRLNPEDSRSFLNALPPGREVWAYEPHDRFFSEELRAWAVRAGARLTLVPSPSFLTRPGEWKGRRLLMGDFYRWQRLRLNILVDFEGQPEGGRWSFDEDNRQKIPKSTLPPHWEAQRPKPEVEEVIALVNRHFANHPGTTEGFRWAVDRAGALDELDRFVEERLDLFGPYEDAVSQAGDRLWHSALSPYLNAGLLLPGECVARAVEAYRGGRARLSSVEGFVRQIIGWREFIKLVDGMYPGRNLNQLGHYRRLAPCWREGTTGLLPLDMVIRRVQANAWCHHIERLMIAGAAMLMVEADPQDAYDWFMEMFIDSADWVMAPNVFGMSQFSDGGLFATKPYLSGSSYLLKMSDLPRGPWCEVWDGLYWRFVDRHRSLFSKNPRMAVMLGTLDKMEPGRRDRILRLAEDFVQRSTFPAAPD
jgi:deoxyribodipyrimidine photolyase-related protein